MQEGVHISPVRPLNCTEFSSAWQGDLSNCATAFCLKSIPASDIADDAGYVQMSLPLDHWQLAPPFVSQSLSSSHMRARSLILDGSWSVQCGYAVTLATTFVGQAPFVQEGVHISSVRPLHCTEFSLAWQGDLSYCATDFRLISITAPYITDDAGNVQMPLH